MFMDVEKVFINECFLTLLCTFFKLVEGTMEKCGVIIKLFLSYPHSIVDNFTRVKGTYVFFYRLLRM